MTRSDIDTEAKQSVVMDCELPQSPETVWHALTDPALLEQWLLPNDFDERIGRPFEFFEANGETIECEVLEAVPHQLLRYSWRHENQNNVLDTEVTFVLTQTEEGGTHLRLVHSGFPGEIQDHNMVSMSACRETRMHRHSVKPIICQGVQLQWAA